MCTANNTEVSVILYVKTKTGHRIWLLRVQNPAYTVRLVTLQWSYTFVTEEIKSAFLLLLRNLELSIIVTII